MAQLFDDLASKLIDQEAFFHAVPVQSGARRDGIAGIYGNDGIVESASCRI